MQSEPSKADPPKRKRRRFQFRLRTLLIALFALIACGYVGWQAKIVLERRTMLRHIELDDKGYPGTRLAPNQPAIQPEKELSWIRRVLGDQWINEVLLPPDTSKEERDRIRAIFPEAEFRKIMERHPDGSPWKSKAFED